MRSLYVGNKQAEKYRDWHVLYHKLMAKRIYRKQKKNVETTCLPQINFLFKMILNIIYDKAGYKIYMKCLQGNHKVDSKFSRKMKMFKTGYNKKEQIIRYE